MENQELMRYLKDAIEQETSIAQQEEIITKHQTLSLQRKPVLQEGNKPKPPKEKKYDPSMGLIFLVIFLLIGALVPLAIGYANLSSANATLEEYAEYADDYFDYYYSKYVSPAKRAKSSANITITIGWVMLAGGVLGLAYMGVQSNKHHEEYAGKLSAYEAQCRQIDKQNQEYEVEYKRNLATWTQTNTEMHAYMSKPLAESRALLDRFYASEIIYPKYRTLPALTSIYEYFMTGRCTELTGPHGAYNLYEDELRKDTVISQLNTVIENLEQIRQNQYMLYQQVKAIQENTTVIASELKQIKGYTIQIAQLTALNAYYAALTERNTRITMYYHL